MWWKRKIRVTKKGNRYFIMIPILKSQVKELKGTGRVHWKITFDVEE